jgi:hypothetical protein
MESTGVEGRPHLHDSASLKNCAEKKTEQGETSARLVRVLFVRTRFRVQIVVAVAAIALGGCAASTPLAPIAPAVTVASSSVASAQPVASASANALRSASDEATEPTPGAPGALVFDESPLDAAEIYEDDVPIAVDVGDQIATPAGPHKIELVMKGLVVWSAKIRVPANGTVHVRIPAKYATAYAN